MKTHHNQLIELHKNGEWVCSTTIEYMRDHRKRYSELATKGYTFDAIPCSGVCGKKHSSRLFMRRLKSKPPVQVVKLVERADGTRVAQLSFI